MCDLFGTNCRYLWFTLGFALFFIIMRIGQYIACFSCHSSYFLFTNTLSDNTSSHNTEKPIRVDDISIECIESASHLDGKHDIFRKPKLLAPLINSNESHSLPYHYSRWRSSVLLQRQVTQCEHLQIIRLLTIIDRMCRSYNLTYMMHSGTLLGSWRHHDLIPWDDDADIMVSIKDQSRLLDGLNALNTTSVAYHYYVYSKKPINEFCRVYFKRNTSVSKFPWTFPFVDIFFYATNESHLWLYNRPEQLLVELQYIFPLIMRPFGQLWLPAPKQPLSFLPFDIEINCVGNYWDHRNETFVNITTQKCVDLTDVYPFVHREIHNGSMTEILRINSTIIHTVIYN
uniref:Lipopolysaccharide choline phosphotransferase-like protein n=1 Tax=Adineta vaga TaxID=104782 RepID=B3G4H8_ADIVA|nr:lipopolysaccharide choline phosphotransferase-like protein [Adineta vaga]